MNTIAVNFILSLNYSIFRSQKTDLFYTVINKRVHFSFFTFAENPVYTETLGKEELSSVRNTN
ncbi:hypothetical protein EG346_08560 [Chryseobacterium carnipullorum]|uniref:Uncharacterized protein n=1 Tax=Chryseobacterium carnipullorum TaxID=1124835 RepID=A0A3G6NQZ4_CHRCU|nr:hypothetical protein EG346_08560 [Chryseobacterium carnipullorum]AZA67533.1 hypothetical protein EG345_24775 [Chryseobacterium carnipullorum]